MNKLIDFTDKVIEGVKLGRTHDEVHPAWKDDTNKDFLICYELFLSFQGNSFFIVKPCEVNLPERYPSLGLSITESEPTKMESTLSGLNLPSKVVHIEQTDFLGEDVINQYKLTLQNNQSITIRHVFPPMSMGVKVEQ